MTVKSKTKNTAERKGETPARVELCRVSFLSRKQSAEKRAHMGDTSVVIFEAAFNWPKYGIWKDSEVAVQPGAYTVGDLIAFSYKGDCWLAQLRKRTKKQTIHVVEASGNRMKFQRDEYELIGRIPTDDDLIEHDMDWAWPSKGINAGAILVVRIGPVRVGRLIAYEYSGMAVVSELVSRDQKGNITVSGPRGKPATLKPSEYNIEGEVIEIRYKPGFAAPKPHSTFTVSVTKPWPAEKMEVGDELLIRRGKVRHGDLAMYHYRGARCFGYVYLDDEQSVRVVGQSGRPTVYARADVELIGRVKDIIKPNMTAPHGDEAQAQIAEARRELGWLTHAPENETRRTELLGLIKRLESQSDRREAR
jgi:hypothetical protein